MVDDYFEKRVKEMDKSPITNYEFQINYSLGLCIDKLRKQYNEIIAVDGTVSENEDMDIRNVFGREYGFILQLGEESGVCKSLTGEKEICEEVADVLDTELEQDQ